MTTPEFEIVGCHANRAGQASLTLRHLASGAVVSIHHVPFEHSYDETVGQECSRIQAAAADLAEQALLHVRAGLAASARADAA